MTKTFHSDDTWLTRDFDASSTTSPWRRRSSSRTCCTDSICSLRTRFSDSSSVPDWVWTRFESRSEIRFWISSSRVWMRLWRRRISKSRSRSKFWNKNKYCEIKGSFLSCPLSWYFMHQQLFIKAFSSLFNHPFNYCRVIVHFVLLINQLELKWQLHSQEKPKCMKICSMAMPLLRAFKLRTEDEGQGSIQFTSSLR